MRTNQIPRQIPEQVWYMQPWASCLMGGILPFGAVFIEMFFIMSSIWNHQFYYMFSFLFIVFIILALTCAEITIVMCYFQLCSEVPPHTCLLLLLPLLFTHCGSLSLSLSLYS